MVEKRVFTMKARMERILIKLAQRHAPYLLTNLSADIDARLRVLADGLAKNGVLVIAGAVPDENYHGRVSEWVGGYGDLYQLLVQGLFPSLARFDPVYADNNRPPIVVMEGQPAALIAVLGGYVAPFLALRQHDRMLSQAELRGVMQFILDELEAADLPRQKYTYLWQEGVKILLRLFKMDVEHYAVTSFARPLFEQIQQEQIQAEHTPQLTTGRVVAVEAKAADVEGTEGVHWLNVPVIQFSTSTGQARVFTGQGTYKVGDRVCIGYLPAFPEKARIMLNPWGPMVVFGGVGATLIALAHFV
jgi:hypothetical protein